MGIIGAANSTVYLEQYRELGYAVVKGVFSPDEVRELAGAFDEVYARGLSHGASFRHQNVLFRLAEDRELGPIVRMVQWPSYFQATLDRYRVDRRLLSIVQPLLGNDLKQIINQLHWKPPGASMVEFGYHQDIRSRRPREAYRQPATSYVQTAIAIDRNRAENGALKIYPGSHKLGELSMASGRHMMDRALRDEDLEGLGLDPAGLIDLELEPGDVALWHLYTLHGSGPNRTSGDRRLYINGFVTAANCDRGEWVLRDDEVCALGEPALVHYEDLYRRPEPHYVAEE